jgi:hypothetical protein
MFLCILIFGLIGIHGFLLFSLMKKVTKKYSWDNIVFFVFMNLRFQSPYFHPKNHRTNFPIAIPAARVSHSARGSLPAASAEILTVIF